jgi:hypothetical protein
MSSGDSQRLPTALFDHINQPDFQVRYSAGTEERWRCGTNPVAQHYAVADYPPQYRLHASRHVVNDRSPRQ